MPPFFSFIIRMKEYERERRLKIRDLKLQEAAA